MPPTRSRARSKTCSGAPAYRPNLAGPVGAFDPDDAGAFLTAAEHHQAAFEALLAEHEVPIRTFADFDELARFWRQKDNRRTR
jgi:hypothetical protein